MLDDQGSSLDGADGTAVIDELPDEPRRLRLRLRRRRPDAVRPGRLEPIDTFVNAGRERGAAASLSADGVGPAPGGPQRPRPGSRGGRTGLLRGAALVQAEPHRGRRTGVARLSGARRTRRRASRLCSIRRGRARPVSSAAFRRASGRPRASRPGSASARTCCRCSDRRRRCRLQPVAAPADGRLRPGVDSRRRDALRQPDRRGRRSGGRRSRRSRELQGPVATRSHPASAGGCRRLRDDPDRRAAGAEPLRQPRRRPHLRGYGTIAGDRDRLARASSRPARSTDDLARRRSPSGKSPTGLPDRSR